MPDSIDRCLWLRSLSTDICGTGKRPNYRTISPPLSLQTQLALDGMSLGEYQSATWTRGITADGGDNPVIVDRLATLNFKITAPSTWLRASRGKCDFWGNSSYAISCFARVNLLVSLSTLDKNL